MSAGRSASVDTECVDRGSRFTAGLLSVERRRLNGRASYNCSLAGASRSPSIIDYSSRAILVLTPVRLAAIAGWVMVGGTRDGPRLISQGHCTFVIDADEIPVRPQ